MSMGKPMAHRRRNITASLILLAASCLFALVTWVAAPEALAKGGGSACAKWGKTAPERLQPGQAREAIVCLLNAERSSRGLRPLERNKKLQKAAQRHNEEMLGTGCFAHECPGEPTLDERLEGVSYLVGSLVEWAFGENVAWGLKDRGAPRAIVAAWMDSSGHRANILHRDFREVGVGFSAGTPDSNSDPGGIYTTDFGLRVG